MKKLNRKGFTLVELLAVIIILAIVVGITIPAVLTTIRGTREKAFQSSVDEVANWLDRQAQSFLVGDSEVSTTDTTYIAKCTTAATSTTAATINATCTVDSALLAAAGVKPANFSNSGNEIEYDSGTGRYCVKLTGAEKGDYQSTEQLKSATCS